MLSKCTFQESHVYSVFHLDRNLVCLKSLLPRSDGYDLSRLETRPQKITELSCHGHCQCKWTESSQNVGLVFWRVDIVNAVQIHTVCCNSTSVGRWEQPLSYFLAEVEPGEKIQLWYFPCISHTFVTQVR